jgi:hypothetical protein
MWRDLTTYMSVSILVPIAIFAAILWVTKGHEQSFRHVPPVFALLAIPAVVALSATVALGIALISKLMSVRITDLHLEGRNYWGIKRRLPLNELSSMSRFDVKGYRATIVSAGKHGQVYVVDQTENVDDLLSLIGTYLESNDGRRNQQPG